MFILIVLWLLQPVGQHLTVAQPPVQPALKVEPVNHYFNFEGVQPLWNKN